MSDPEHLRAQARGHQARAEELREAATGLVTLAQGVSRHLQPVAANLAEGTWVGPASAAARAELRDISSQIHSAAGMLEDAAATAVTQAAIAAATAEDLWRAAAHLTAADA